MINCAHRWNHGQACCAGSRIFVQEAIYDKFVEKLVEEAKAVKLGDPFGTDIDQGPQISQIQYDVRCPHRFYAETGSLIFLHSVLWATSIQARKLAQL